MGCCCWDSGDDEAEELVVVVLVVVVDTVVASACRSMMVGSNMCEKLDAVVEVSSRFSVFRRQHCDATGSWLGFSFSCRRMSRTISINTRLCASVSKSLDTKSCATSTGFTLFASNLNVIVLGRFSISHSTMLFSMPSTCSFGLRSVDR